MTKVNGYGDLCYAPQNFDCFDCITILPHLPTVPGSNLLVKAAIELKQIRPIEKRFVAKEHWHIAHESYDTMRTLTNVSCQVHAELNRVFWNDVHIDANSFWHLFLRPLQGQPAVRQGVITFHFEAQSKDDASNFDDKITFGDFCYYISNKASLLDEVRFVLGTTPKTSRHILASANSLPWVRTFRKISIKTLKVILIIAGDDEEDPGPVSTMRATTAKMLLVAIMVMVVVKVTIVATMAVTLNLTGIPMILMTLMAGIALELETEG